MQIELTRLHVDCIVGAYDRERDAPQPLIVDVRLRFAQSASAWSGADVLQHSVDYAGLCRELDFILREARFRYLESAAYALAQYILLPRHDAANVIEVAVALEKPQALCGAAVPRVSMTLKQSEQNATRERKTWGTVDVVWESRDSGLYRLNIDAGSEIPLHEHRRMDEAEMILSPNIQTSEQVLPVGAAIRWPRFHPHRHRNLGNEVGSILCIDRPRFDPSDEVEILGTAASFSFTPPWAAP